LEVKRVAVIGLLLAVGALVGSQLAGESAVTQPVAFPHRAHLELTEQKLECKSCHEGVATKISAGRPSTKKCLSCHSGETNSAEEKKLQAFGENKTEVPWQRVWRLPPDVFFSHRQHVAVAKVECKACHGDMASLDRPPARALKRLTMAQCIACHDQSPPPPAGAPKAVAARRIADNCAACHR
jgi:Zn finger protein HypA/HybF involved in hydrogenase expression